jgi:hypothetical protein
MMDGENGTKEKEEVGVAQLPQTPKTNQGAADSTRKWLCASRPR